MLEGPPVTPFALLPVLWWTGRDQLWVWGTRRVEAGRLAERLLKGAQLRYDAGYGCSADEKNEEPTT